MTHGPIDSAIDKLHEALQRIEKANEIEKLIDSHVADLAHSAQDAETSPRQSGV